ncbi:MAG TPA: hypothetical protein VFW07_23020 [Parafilimonas sp.]|nr:hypothetical protein [Parafilimonas sp.]
MPASKSINNPGEKKVSQLHYEEDLFRTRPEKQDEIESDGSASAFDETERVTEDNFDNLSEK